MVAASVGVAAGRADPHVHPLVAQPRWLASYCEREARRLHTSILCPTQVPSDFSPTPNTRSLSRSPSAYIIDAGGFDASGAQTSHWVIGAFHGWGKHGLNNWTPVGQLHTVGTATVRRHHGHWYLHAAGIFEGHLMLAWRERGWVYVISDHIDRPFNNGPRVGVGSRALRGEMLKIAAAMQHYLP
jgi:hypothetical protein